MGHHIGNRMLEVTRYIRDNPGCSKKDAAIATCPGLIEKSTYHAIDRAIRRGMVRQTNSKHIFGYALYATRYGKMLTRQNEIEKTNTKRVNV